MKRSGVLKRLVPIVVPLLLMVSPPAADAFDSLEKCIDAADKVVDYVAVIHQRQRIRDKLGPEEVILYKFRRPNWVSIRWTGEVKSGMEVFYREGHDDNRLTAHLSGALGMLVFHLRPDSKRALDYSRHPVNESSLIYMLQRLDTSIRYAQSHPEDSMEIIDSGTISVFGTPLKEIVITTPYRPGGPYYAPRSIFGIDEGINLPRYFASYGPQGELWEEYRYEELKINVGLTDSDFE